VAARELEETLDISDIFAAAIALLRQTAAEAELAAETDGDDGADICDFHENSKASFPRIECAVSVVCTLQGSARSGRL
jgi:hypothetical protein